MTFQDKVINLIQDETDTIIQNGGMIGDPEKWNMYKTRYINFMDIIKNDLYCEVVDKNGHVYLTTKGDKILQYERVSDFNYKIKFKVNKNSFINTKVKPEIFLILYDDKTIRNDVMSMFKKGLQRMEYLNSAGFRKWEGIIEYNFTKSGSFNEINQQDNKGKVNFNGNF